MTKQEIIKKAYIDLIGEDNYNIVKGRIVDGVCHMIENNVLITPTLMELSLKRGDERVVAWMECTEGYFMPKSIAGIEDNNGWTRIYSEKDLPKEDCRCEFIKDSGKQLYGRFEDRMGGLFIDESKRFEHPEYRTESITHWKKIETFKKPIY